MIIININKAKTIAHDMRRSARSEEFAPLDTQIAKQIPGADIQSLEAQRQLIRDKYAVMQVEIDSASSTEELKLALGIS